MNKTKQKEFKAELRALLLKYNASIGFDCSESSDLHGVHKPEIVVYLGSDKVQLTNTYCCYPVDLK